MNVLLIDDHAMFREGVALLLQPLAPALHVVEAGTAEDGIAALDRLGGADLVLVDIGLPGMSGLDAIGLMHQRHPGTPVVALSSMDDRGTVLGAIEAGAMGFISKTMNGQDLRRRLALILDGMVVLPSLAALPGAPPVSSPAASAVASAVAPAPRAPAATDAAGSSAGSRPESRPTTAADLGITPRQADVLQLIVQGCVAKDIERRLQLSAGTVKAHTSAVLRALNVTTRTQAVVRAAQLQLQLPRGPGAPAGKGEPS
jgi:DNA-binding NarL/FixJ family response regulator